MLGRQLLDLITHPGVIEIVMALHEHNGSATLCQPHDAPSRSTSAAGRNLPAPIAWTYESPTHSPPLVDRVRWPDRIWNHHSHHKIGKQRSLRRVKMEIADL